VGSAPLEFGSWDLQSGPPLLSQSKRSRCSSEQGAELACSCVTSPCVLCSSTARPCLTGYPFGVCRCEGGSDVVLEAASSSLLDLSTKCCVSIATCT